MSLISLFIKLLTKYKIFKPELYLRRILHCAFKMGNWKLEVARMGMYTSFPVALFFFFNQPKYFEEWVTNTKRQIFPPENKQDRENIQNLIKEMRKKQMQALEGE